MSIKRLFTILLLLPLCACGPVISSTVMGKVDSSLTFNAVLQNPDAYRDKSVLWGGRIVEVMPQNGTTYVEVLQMPLGWRDKPEEAYASEGKFLILFKKMLNFSRFDRGKKITVAGPIQGTVEGEKMGLLTEKNYRYPVLLNEAFHLWKPSYPYSTSDSYGPWWYGSPSGELRF